MAARLEPQDSNVSNEVIAAFAIEVNKAQRDIDEATGRRRAILKRSKADGVKNDILLSVIKMKKQDEDEVRARLRDVLRYAKVIVPHIKLGQADLFDGVDDRPLNTKAQGASQDWTANERGYETGLAGGSMDDCVFAAGTEGRVHFEQGFWRGQAVIADRMGQGVKKADPSLFKKRAGIGQRPQPDQEGDADAE